MSRDLFENVRVPRWAALAGGAGGAAGAGAGAAGAGAAGAGAGAAAGAAGAGAGAAGAAGAGAGAAGAAGMGAAGAAGGGMLAGAGEGLTKLYHMADVSKFDPFTDPETGSFSVTSLFSPQQRQEYSRLRQAMLETGAQPAGFNAIKEGARLSQRQDDGNDWVREEIMRRLMGG